MKKIFIFLFISLLTITNVEALKDTNELTAANTLADAGIIVDHELAPEKYNLEKNILRQEIAGVIAKMAEVPEKTGCRGYYNDVMISPENSWACPRIESLYDAGILAANPKYRPMSYVSKAEAIGFILKGLYNDDFEEYKKNYTINAWETNAINYATELNILHEPVENYSENASRGFIFSIMYNAYIQKNPNLQIQAPIKNETLTSDDEEIPDEIEQLLKEFEMEIYTLD